MFLLFLLGMFTFRIVLVCSTDNVSHLQMISKRLFCVLHVLFFVGMSGGGVPVCVAVTRKYR